MWNTLRKTLFSAKRREVAGHLFRHLRAGLWQTTKDAVLQGRTIGVVLAVAAAIGMYLSVAVMPTPEAPLIGNLTIGAVAGFFYGAIGMFISAIAVAAGLVASEEVKNYFTERRSRRFNTGNTDATNCLQWLVDHDLMDAREARTCAKRLRNSEDSMTRSDAIEHLFDWYRSEQTKFGARQEETIVNWLDRYRKDAARQFESISAYLQSADESGVDPVVRNMDLPSAAHVALTSDNPRLLDAVLFLLDTHDEYATHTAHEVGDEQYGFCRVCRKVLAARKAHRELQDAVFAAARHVSSPDRELRTMANKFRARAEHNHLAASVTFDDSGTSTEDTAVTSLAARRTG